MWWYNLKSWQAALLGLAVFGIFIIPIGLATRKQSTIKIDAPTRNTKDLELINIDTFTVPSDHEGNRQMEVYFDKVRNVTCYYLWTGWEKQGVISCLGPVQMDIDERIPCRCDITLKQAPAINYVPSIQDMQTEIDRQDKELEALDRKEIQKEKPMTSSEQDFVENKKENSRFK